MTATVHRIACGKANVYWVQTKTGALLVDAGVPGKFPLLQRALAKRNLSWASLQLIVLTHVHYDHVGNAAAIQGESAAPVVVHRSEQEDLLRGRTPFPQGTLTFSRWISRLGNRFDPNAQQFEPVTADILVDDSLDLQAWNIFGNIVHTPGHTRGSMCIIVEDYHCFCGDTLFHIWPGSVWPPFANNVGQLQQSWRRLLDTGCEWFYPGHGLPFRRSLLEQNIRRRWGN